MSAIPDHIEACAVAVPESRPGSHSTRTALAYGLPSAAIGFTYMLNQLYLMKYTTDVLMIAPAVMGIILAVSRIWDAVFDPIVGYLSDITRHRLGRRKLWILAGSVPLTLSFIATFIPLPGLGSAGLVAWMSVAVIVYFTALAAVMIPHMALGSELSTDYHMRSKIYGSRHVFFVLGSILSLVAMFAFIKAGKDGPEALRAVQDPIIIVSAIVCIVLIGCLLLGAPEPKENQGRVEKGFLKKFAHVWANRHARIILMTTFIENLGTAAISVMTVYFAQYVVGDPLVAPLFVLAFMVPSMLSVGFWVALSRRYGKSRLWLWSMMGTGLCFLGFFVTPFIDSYTWRLIVVFGATLGAGFANGCGGTMGPSILGDVVDADEHATGERKEGAYFAIWQTVVKGATGVMMMLAGFALQFSGFLPNQEQTMQVKLTITSLNGLLPFICFMIGAWVLKHFKLTPEEHARIRSDLDARRQCNPAA
ncbi:MFS transporter [Polaromonas hydrogenivorans]|uniref:MFS transporter n=1 Tax=Polaromonas hydrogenivorans TaxID=335476 RepID=A0AAU7LY23_9BURK